jgi:Coiled-coil N-terminus of cGMP-dependent protein kinase
MRFCFNGFCLGHQRPPLAVEQSSQTTLTLASAIDNFKLTTFFNKSFVEDEEETEETFERKKVVQNFTMIAQEDQSNFQNNNNINSDSPSVMEGETSRIELEEDSHNNNLPLSNMDLMKLELFNASSEAGSMDVNMDDLEVKITSKERDLIRVIQAKEIKIKELEELLVKKEEEIANLRSHLDKFQSVFPFRTTGGAMGGRKMGGRNIQRQRATGISAEPQQNTMHELLNVSFPKYEKQER